MKKEIKYALIFIALILTTSWTFALFVFSKDERIGLFNLVMFFPAIIAIVLNSVRYKSFRLVFKPLISRINLKSVLFALFYPLLFIGLLAVIVSITGIATFNADKLPNLLNLPLTLIIIGPVFMFGEEYGWRGFLLSEQARKTGWCQIN